MWGFQKLFALLRGEFRGTQNGGTTNVEPQSRPRLRRQNTMESKPKRLSDSYTLGKLIANGRFARLYDGVDVSTSEVVAIKAIIKEDLSEFELNLLMMEIDILKEIRHQNILKSLLHLQEGSTIYLVVERDHGGELLDRIVEMKFYFEDDAAMIVETVAKALAYLHDMGVCHRDLKPENLVLRQISVGGLRASDIKIIDFGLARKNDGCPIAEKCGT